MAGKKENITALFTDTRSRVIILFTIGFLVLTISVGYYKFKSPTLGSVAGAKFSAGPGGIQSIPGSTNASAQYVSLQEKQNVDQAKKASTSGHSAIPTLVRSQAFGAGVEAVGPVDGKGALGFSALNREDTIGPQQSLWRQQLKDSHCNKSFVTQVLSQGAGLSDLKSACSCAQLRDNGYHLSELESICSCPDLKAAGFNAAQLKSNGYSATRLKQCGFSACDLHAAGFSAQELKDAGFTDGELKGAGYSDAEIDKAGGLPEGVTAEDVRRAGCSADALMKLREQGVSAAAIRRISGCSVTQLKAAGFSANQLKKAGFTAAELKKAGFTAAELKKAGFTAAELKKAGFTSPLLSGAIVNSAVNCSPATLKAAKAHGKSATSIRDAFGCSAADLKAAGYTARELKEAGFSAAQLKEAGFSAAQLKNAGFSPAQLNDARVVNCSPASLMAAKARGMSAFSIRNTTGCSVADLKAAGYTAAELKAAGYTAAELKAASFSANDLKKAGFTARELKDAGFSPAQLKDAGFSAAQLKDAGFSAAQLKDAGFSAAQLKDAGFSAAQLKDAGFSATQLKDAGIETAEPTTRSSDAIIPSLGGAPTDRAAQLIANKQHLDAIVAQQESRMASQQYQQKIQQRTGAMTGAANQALQAWKTVSTQSLVTGSNEQKDKNSNMASATSGHMGSQENDASSLSEKGSASPVIHAGEVLFAVLDTSVNSDQPGPILATIVAGRFEGAKLIGSFQLPANADKMVISFNMMSVPGAVKTTSINAYAIDPNTARTALSSRTDHHYLLRYGSLFAATFIEGFGNAFQSQNTTITIGGTGGVSNTTVSSGAGRSVLENAVIGLSTLGKSWGQVAMQQVNTPVTVDVFSGTGLGILFTQDVASI